MKKAISLFLLVLSLQAFAQKTSVNWGEEFKLKKGSTDLLVMASDNTGIYVKESHFTMKSYFLIGATMRESATLIKLDKSLAMQYQNDFNKELKGKEFETFFFLKDKLFLLGTDYSKKEKKLTLFAAEINKATGELAGEWQEITSWQKEEKGDEINFKATYNADSSQMVLVSTIEGKEKNEYEVKIFDSKLKTAATTIHISNEFDPKTFQLEDVLYMSNSNVVMVGRVYEYQEGKKKKAKFLDFKNYIVRIYNNTGSMVKEINTDISAKWLISSKVVQTPNKELVLAAFYSNEKKGKEINGLLVQRIDAQNGNIITTSKEDINTSMITALENDDADETESKAERKEREKLEKIQDEEEGFSKYMRFRNFVVTPDNGIIILAEKYKSYTTSTSNYSMGVNGSPGTTSTSTFHVYESGDLMMSKIDKNGNISWLKVLPKEQREVIQTGHSNTYGRAINFNAGYNFFDDNTNMPFYSGFGILANGSNLSIIFNDHVKNSTVLQLGQKVKRASSFGKTDCYNVQLDVLSGKYTRKPLFSNKDIPTAMPRLGSVLGNTLFLVGKEDRMLGKSKIALGKIAIE
jgi:hypothetical protein